MAKYVTAQKAADEKDDAPTDVRLYLVVKVDDVGMLLLS